MGNKISLVVLDHNGSSLKQATVSKAILKGIALSLALLLLLVGWGIYNYISLRKIVFEDRAAKADISKAQAEIASQRKQIQEFASRIDTLKCQLADLNAFENKIRIIANLKDDKGDQGGLFGVGGSLPEDLDPKLAVTDSHKRLITEMHEQVNELSKVASGQEKRFKTLILKLENKRNILACTPSIRPVDGWITSKFGYRISPFTNRREFHRGLDIAARRGTPIVATADGVVTFAGKKGLLGLCIVINHGHGLVTRYGHASKLLKKPGDKVKRGEEIAEVGSTGRSTGPHVHYEVFLNNVPINPQKYIMSQALAKH
jgi:murein DD-endopeptidase MepM/ murein hydrolase activator NlpD